MSSLCANDIKRLARAQRIKKIWKRIVMSMATVVVFVTTYMLILPAITISQDVYCGIEEHEHTQSCYSNPDADIETADNWEATIPTQLDGNSAERLIAVAKSQLRIYGKY